MNICPICRINNTYKKTETVKDGYTDYIDGKYFFRQTGIKESTTEYWSCKECTKKLNAFDYMEFLINNQWILEDKE